MREAVVVASSRTALAKSFRGSFNMTRPEDLAAHCIKDVLRKTPQLDPKEIEDVVLGCGQPHGPQGQNVARLSAIWAGLPVTTAAITVNRFFFSGEIAPMKVTKAVLDKKTGEKIGTQEVCCDRDECNRPDTTLEGLLALKPYFDPNSGQGTVTAGNSSQLSDGASATLLMSRQRAEALGVKPQVVFRGIAVAGCEPDEMGIGPVFAVPKLLRRHGLRVGDIDLWELNEAFAVQVIYCRDRLGIDPERLNVNGGSISIGHPF